MGVSEIRGILSGILLVRGIFVRPHIHTKPRSGWIRVLQKRTWISVEDWRSLESRPILLS